MSTELCCSTTGVRCTLMHLQRTVAPCHAASRHRSRPDQQLHRDLCAASPPLAAVRCWWPPHECAVMQPTATKHPLPGFLRNRPLHNNDLKYYSSTSSLIRPSYWLNHLKSRRPGTLLRYGCYASSVLTLTALLYTTWRVIVAPYLQPHLSISTTTSPALLQRTTPSIHAAQPSIKQRSKSTAPLRPRLIEVQPVASYLHDPEAFTQGLQYHNGSLYESTGLYGSSTLREVELLTGRVKRQAQLGAQYFGEGLCIVDNLIYILTWKEKQCLVYDLHSFELLRKLSLPTDGWGITYHEQLQQLIVSDGSHKLFFRNPQTFEVVSELEVTDLDGANRRRGVKYINELEFINGYIYANVWLSDRIAVIDPQTGHVIQWIVLEHIVKTHRSVNPDSVANGIAYDPQRQRLYVTGKLWNALYEVQLPQIAHTT